MRRSSSRRHSRRTSSHLTKTILAIVSFVAIIVLVWNLRGTWDTMTAKVTYVTEEADGSYTVEVSIGERIDAHSYEPELYYTKVGEEEIYVSVGDTLNGIAIECCPEGYSYLDMADEIMHLNGISGELRAGESILVPVY